MPPNSPERIRAFLTWVNGARLLGRSTGPGRSVPSSRPRTRCGNGCSGIAPSCGCCSASLRSVPSCNGRSSTSRPPGCRARTGVTTGSSRRTPPCPRRPTPPTPRGGTRPLDELAEHLAGVTRWPDAEPVVARLLDAVRRRDHAAYLDGHHRLARLHDVRARVAQREQTGRRLWPPLPPSPLPSPPVPAGTSGMSCCRLRRVLELGRRRHVDRRPYSPRCQRAAEADQRHRGPHPGARATALRDPGLESRGRADQAVAPLARQPGAVRRTGSPLRQGHREVPRRSAGPKSATPWTAADRPSRSGSCRSTGSPISCGSSRACSTS